MGPNDFLQPFKQNEPVAEGIEYEDITCIETKFIDKVENRSSNDNFDNIKVWKDSQYPINGWVESTADKVCYSFL